jgi:tetratricopeptide (TPR) repeat protein
VTSEVGVRIKAARLRSSLTQQQLAGDRYTKAYISALENGLVRPSVAALEYLASRLGMNASTLLGDARPAWSRLDADLLLAAGDYDKAADAYRSLLDEISPKADPAMRAELLRGESEALVRLDREAEATRSASEAVALFEKAGRAQDASLASYWLGAAQNQQGNTAEARSILNAILTKMRSGEQTDPDFKLRVLMGMASNESRDGNYEQALTYLEELRGLAEALDDRRRATYLFMLAYSYTETGDYEAAIRTGYQALALFKASEAAYEMAQLENDLALAYLNLGNVGKAQELANSSAERWSKIGNDRHRANVLDTKAQIELAREKWREAIALATEALELGRSEKSDVAIADALLTIARAHAGMARAGDAAGTDEAKSYFEQAAAVARENKRTGMVRRVLQDWAEFLAAIGDYKEAFELSREAQPAQR